MTSKALMLAAALVYGALALGIGHDVVELTNQKSSMEATQ